MSVKCIAIGNRIMRDDGIGIRVVEAMIPLLNQENIQVILGETDPYYAIREIVQGDFLFVVDATILHKVPGTITTIPLQQALMIPYGNNTQHQQSFISLLKIYQKLVDGYLIGIEADTIEFGLELSTILEDNMQAISHQVYEIISQICSNINYVT